MNRVICEVGWYSDNTYCGLSVDTGLDLDASCLTAVGMFDSECHRFGFSILDGRKCIRYIQLGLKRIAGKRTVH